MTEHSMNPDESLKENTQGMLRIFVYGTLKRGFWNHDRFCRGVLDIREAEVRGRLYEMHSGIPVLQIPDRDVLAHGSPDPLADVATQARLSEQLASYPVPALQSATAGDWGRVYGELLTFDDPETRLPAIDRLEGFRPGGSSLYKRVLVPVCIEHAMALPCWLYVGANSVLNRAILTGRSTWSPKTQ
jgi:gamma-glutamylcyclotransferase (GGCT)/AIG2-like uncharacterized protein YtfP